MHKLDRKPCRIYGLERSENEALLIGCIVDDEFNQVSVSTYVFEAHRVKELHECCPANVLEFSIGSVIDR